MATAAGKNSALRGRRQWRRCLLGSAFYLLICGGAAFCLIALLHLSGYRTPSRDLGLNRQSQAIVGTYPSASNATLDVLESDEKNETTKGRPKPLPPHPWNPFLLDPLPLTHLTSRACYFPPWTFFTVCSPAETPAEVARYGHWIRVPRDIGHKASRSYQELYYRRGLSMLSPLEDRAITGVKVVEDREAEKAEVLKELREGGWEPTGDNLRADVWPMRDRLPPAHLWITRAKTVDGREVAAINEVDVLWGEREEVEPWWGFERLDGGSVPIYGGEKDASRTRTEIVVRRSTDSALRPPPSVPSKLRFPSNDPSGKFRILQIADLHFSTTKGECRDTGDFKTRCEDEGADATTMSWLRTVIRRTEPGLVVLTGDQLNGQGTSWDQLSVLLKIGHLVADAGIPWTAIFGNHDSEDGLPRKEQMMVLKSMPYFVGDVGPADDNRTDAEGGEWGVGNFMLPIRAPKGGQDEQLFSLFFLDSHAYAGNAVKHVWDKVTGGETEYDWIKPVQIDWFLRTASAVPSILRPFSPSASSTQADSTFGIWGGIGLVNNTDGLPPPQQKRGFVRAKRREATRKRQEKKEQSLRRPNAMLFQHIPLPEAYAAADTNPANGAEKVHGRRLEGTGNPKHNSGFFENGILKASEVGGEEAQGGARVGGSVGVEGMPMVKVVVNGHCHVTDECRRVRDVWHCFGGGSSYAGYGKDEFERRVRVFELEDFGETIRTWKVLDPRVVEGKGANGGEGRKERWEEVVLVGEGTS